MGYGQGINAVTAAVFESVYGSTPVSGFKKVPFVSHTLGEENPLIEDDQLGFGREGLDPVKDVSTNDGDIVVPVDQKAIGFWLKMLLGAPTTTGSAAPYTHVFTSGGGALPSASIEIGNPDVPAYSVHYGACANQMRISMARSGMLNATMSLICQGETHVDVSSVAGTPAALTGARLAQATGKILKDGVALGNVVSADISISNSLDKVEVIREDGRIGGVLPGVMIATIGLKCRFDSLALHNAASDGTPIALEISWSDGTYSLKLTFSRVFLPRVKRPIDGPRGLVQDFSTQVSGAGGHKVVATLVTAQAAYS